MPVHIIVPLLRFTPSATSNHISDYAIAVVLLAASITVLVLVYRAGRWLVFACSPAVRGFEVTPGAITASLGPFGRWKTAWSQLDIEWPEYLFTLELDEDDPLPMKECPPLHIPRTNVLVNSDVMAYGAIEESEWLSLVEPLIRPQLFSDARWVA
jgi:hypothetical protein